jgi:hypothetical protein
MRSAFALRPALDGHRALTLLRAVSTATSTWLRADEYGPFFSGFANRATDCAGTPRGVASAVPITHAPHVTASPVKS